ncbi:hypothetical protein PJP10_31790, partial [Mycobacterium kansasii]
VSFFNDIEEYSMTSKMCLMSLKPGRAIEDFRKYMFCRWTVLEAIRYHRRVFDVIKGLSVDDIELFHADFADPLDL